MEKNINQFKEIFLKKNFNNSAQKISLNFFKREKYQSKDTTIIDLKSSDQNFKTQKQKTNKFVTVKIVLEMKYFFKRFQFKIKRNQLVGVVINIIAKHMKLDLKKINYYIFHQNQLLNPLTEISEISFQNFVELDLYIEKTTLDFFRDLKNFTKNKTLYIRLEEQNMNHFQILVEDLYENKKILSKKNIANVKILNFKKPENYYFIKYYKQIEKMLHHYKFKLLWVNREKHYIIIKINQ